MSPMKKRMISLTAVTLLALSAPIIADKAPSRMKVKINIATVQELDEVLVGVPRTLAERIIKDREKNGPFHSLKDLYRIEQLNDQILDRNRERIVFD
ncbi:ComEA family DNA-binding protein [Endozoicomonas arenosclerae]|uniref:ComEA family DNA-binding protein n=1 Tax=Endozoicomonas arenosclerae TaxID=1633495 RepID=UPI0007841D66|nr:helix-hairpin-helix domain-containing protein [Endozoicomonas arenosclerae]